jgi:hypothetical protein
MSELKKCPFCGERDSDAPFDCVCRQDDLQRMTRAKWNTRPLEDALQARIDELAQWGNQLADAGDDLRAKNAEYAKYISDDQLETKAVERAEKKYAALWEKAMTALQEQPKLQQRIATLETKIAIDAAQHNDYLATLEEQLDAEEVAHEECACEADILRKYIDELEEQLRWIPVSERLPLPNQRVDVQIYGQAYKGYYVHCESRWVVGEFIHSPSVTCWRETPELPTPEVSE